MYIGVDVGSNKIAAAVVNLQTGELTGRLVVPTEAQEGPAPVMVRMIQLIRSVCEKASVDLRRIEGVGIGVPGAFDPRTGKILFLPNMPTGWRGVQMGETVQNALSLPVVLINDARAMVLAEATLGAGRGAENVVGLALGGGIGGGFVLGGRLYTGLDGTAGEIGHQTIDPNGPRCSCGNYGCLEAFVSRPAIVAQGIRVVVQGMTSRISELADFDWTRITVDVIRRAAEAGDEVALEMLQSVGNYLGIGVANLITAFSPDRVILGGSLAHTLGNWLLDPVRTVVRRRCTVVPVEQVQILPAELGRAAALIGPALWASQH